MESIEETDIHSSRRWAAMCALIEGKSLQETADECQINVRTLRRWMHCPDFKKDYEKFQQEKMDRIIASFQDAADEAAKTLKELLKSTNPIIQLRASKIIIDIVRTNSELRQAKKQKAELEKTAVQQAKQIQNLSRTIQNNDKSREELRTLKHSLTQGSFKRPDWISQYTWDNIVRLNKPSVQAT